MISDELPDLEKINKQSWLCFEIAVIFGMALVVGIFSWNLKNDLWFTAFCVFIMTLLLVATCPSIQGETP